MAGELGRRVPTDWEHVENYPLRALSAAETPSQVPVVLGINWYTNFDEPKRSDGTPYTPGARGLFWIGKGDLGSVRGGHAICAKPYGIGDGWWDFYDQGNEGACVGFSCSRMMSLLNRKRYAANWLYTEAQLTDEYSDTPPAEGTSVRAGCEILRMRGHERWYRDHAIEPPAFSEGIDAYRWATDWQEVRDALALPDSQDGIPLLNSWGRYYPHVVHLTDEAGERLLSEDGEAAIPTDR